MVSIVLTSVVGACATGILSDAPDGGAAGDASVGDSRHGIGGGDSTFDQGSSGNPDGTIPSGDSGDDSGDDATDDTSDGGSSDTGGPDVPLILPDGGVYLVFVTSHIYTGALGGLAGADAICQGLATAGGLPGTYKAWLSDDMTSASARLTHGTLPYKLVDGTLVANDWADLTSGTLRHAIDKTEHGGAPPPSTLTFCSGAAAGLAWTDTYADAAPFGSELDGGYYWDTCGEWTIAGNPVQGGGQGGQLGRAAATNSTWSEGCFSYCDCDDAGSCWQASLYCMEQ